MKPTSEGVMPHRLVHRCLRRIRHMHACGQSREIRDLCHNRMAKRSNGVSKPHTLWTRRTFQMRAMLPTSTPQSFSALLALMILRPCAYEVILEAYSACFTSLTSSALSMPCAPHHHQS